MKQKTLNVLLVLGGMVLGAFLFGWPGLTEAQGPDTTFTYQGRLLKDGAYVDGVTCNFRFGLYAGLTGGTPLGTGQQTTTAPVSDGYFTVPLDFGDVFDGNPRYLETQVQCPGDAGFNTLVPRTTLYGVPYAQGVSWSDIDGMPAGFADGTDDDRAYSAGYGLNLDATNVFSVNTTQIQERVTGTCAGQVISAINADGSVSCEADDGEIYTAGEGILIGATHIISADFGGSGSDWGTATSSARSDHSHDGRYYTQTDASLLFLGKVEALGGDLTGIHSLATVVGLQENPVDGTDPSTGQVLKWNGSAWAPAADEGASYGAGYGLNLDASNNFNVDTTQIQQRVTGTCSGQVISAINADGSVTCEADDGDSYTAGDGLDLTGTTFSVDVTDLRGAGLSETANNLVVSFGGTGSATTAAHSDHYHSSLNASDGFPTKVVYVNNDGDVGIGSSSPGAKLDVNGTAQQNITDNGFVKAWARINPNGTVAGSCYNCVPGNTGRYLPFTQGLYKVDFAFDVSSRPKSATLDALGAGSSIGQIGVGSIPGDPSSVWVTTSDSDGTIADKSFTLIIY